jgi:glycerophosphoryl diester phosphodiesterase
MNKPLFIAHRGGGTGVGENKIETIKRTLKSDLIDVIEVDVRKTKDNILVLSHNRGIDIGERRFWIDKVSYHEIRHLGIPTLEEILVLFKTSHKILNLDLKEKNIVGDIIKLLKKNNYIRKIYFDSHDLETLFEVQEEVPNGEFFLSSNIQDSRDFNERRIIKIIAIFLSVLLSRLAIFILKKRLRKIKLDGVSLFYRWANRDFVEDLHTFGFKVFVWGTDSEKVIRELLNINVDGVKMGDSGILEELKDKPSL